MTQRDIKEALPKDLMDDWKDDVIDLLFFFLRNEYIDDNYSDYISFFHEGSLSKNDHDFLLAIKNHRQLPYTFELKNTSKVVLRIHAHEWNQFEVLNNSLLNHLLADTEKYSGIIDAFFQLIVNEKNHAFLKQYDYCKWKSYFITSLTSMYPNIWGVYCELPENEKKVKYKEIIIYNNIQTLCDVNNDKSFNMYANEFNYFIVDEFNKIQKEIGDKLINLKLAIKITNLSELVNDELLMYVINNNLYSISEETIESLLLYFKVINNIGEINRNYFTLIRKINNTNINANITERIYDFVNEIILCNNEDIFEDRIYFAELLNNANLDESQKKRIITQNKIRLDLLSGVIDNTLWPDLLTHGVVVPTWDNIMLYFQHCDQKIDSILIQYISKSENIDELIADDIDEYTDNNQSSEYLLSLFSKFVGNASIPIDLYKKIFICNRWMLDIPENYEQERVLYNIGNRDIAFTKANFSCLTTSKDKIFYLVSYFDEYLKEADVYELNTADLVYLITLDDINYKQIDIFINNINKDNFNLEQVPIASLMQVIDKYKLHDRLAPATIITLIKITNNDSRLNVLMKTIQKFSFAEVKDLLVDIKPLYKPIFSGNNRKCVLSKNEINEDLLDYLRDNNIISTWSYKNDQVLINLKRNRK